MPLAGTVQEFGSDVAFMPPEQVWVISCRLRDRKHSQNIACGCSARYIMTGVIGTPHCWRTVHAVLDVARYGCRPCITLLVCRVHAGQQFDDIAHGSQERPYHGCSF